MSEKNGVDEPDVLLVVDDEPLITDLFSQLISKRGYKVLVAHSGESALQMVRQQDQIIRLIVTDLTMPGMDGIALSEALVLEAPRIPVLIATGFDTDFRGTNTPSNVVGIVNKPFATKALAATIRTILDAGDVP